MSVCCSRALRSLPRVLILADKMVNDTRHPPLKNSFLLFNFASCEIMSLVKFRTISRTGTLFRLLRYYRKRRRLPSPPPLFISFHLTSPHLISSHLAHVRSASSYIPFPPRSYREITFPSVFNFIPLPLPLGPLPILSTVANAVEKTRSSQLSRVPFIRLLR